MGIYDFSDYRVFLAEVLHGPDPPVGGMKRVADAMDVSSSFLSQVLKGSKSLSQEQSFLLGEFLGLDALEQKYLTVLVNVAKATRTRYRRFLQDSLEEIRSEYQRKLGTPEPGQPLDSANQAVFYSTWQYAAVQLLTGTNDHHTLDAISRRFDISPATAKQIVDFLLSTGLCVRSGRTIRAGKRRTHLEDGSPLRARHHMNWRLKAIEEMSKDLGQEAKSGSVFFTAPMRIDERTFRELTGKFREMITQVNQSIDSAGDETLACMNLDWFRI